MEFGAFPPTEPSGRDGAKDDLGERLEKSAREQLERYERLREELSGLSVTVTSEDRTITVRAGAGGAVQDISLTQQALRHGPERLGQLILRTIHDANARAAQELSAMVQDTAPPGFDLAGLMSGELPEIPPADPDAFMRSKGVRW